MKRYTPYFVLGLVFGFVLIRSEAASWYRIQEMFHFQSFHMFGILFSAIVTAALTLVVLKRFVGKPSLEGAIIAIPQKPAGRLNYPLGGFIFGIGWGLIGLCPGPMFALAGAGSLPAILALAGALHGTWLYGLAKQKWRFFNNAACTT